MQMEMLFERLHSSTRKESPDDPLRKISSRISMKASSLLYSLNQNRFQYINKAFSFLVCYMGTFRKPPSGRVEAEEYARALDVAHRQILASSSTTKFTESFTAGDMQCLCSNIQYYPLYTIFLPLSRPGPRTFAANNDISCNQ